MIVFIDSYARCEALKIEPCDSIINTVINTKEPKTILAFGRGHTLLKKDEVKVDASKIFHCDFQSIPENQAVVYAKNMKCLKTFLKGEYGSAVAFEVWEKIVRFTNKGMTYTD